MVHPPHSQGRQQDQGHGVVLHVQEDLMFKWHFKLYEDSLDMYEEHTDTTDDDYDI